MSLPAGAWLQVQGLAPRQFVCGYCGHQVGSDRGYEFVQQGSNQRIAHIFICPSCYGPSFFWGPVGQVPGTPLGRPVDSLPDEIRAIYEEARKSATVGAYTASVLVLRKLLMHIAVSYGATEGEPFAAYVQYLVDKGYAPPGSQPWVDHVRKKGNEANHQIVLMSREEAETLVRFSEMLLKFLYEFPASLPKPAAPKP